MRPPWREYFLGLATQVATRATCNRRHVGCVIVRDNRILATGYNGSPPGEPHCDDVGHAMENGHCTRVVHAESNAVAQAARYGISLDWAMAYVTLQPCRRCMALLKSAGINEVYWLEDYP